MKIAIYSYEDYLGNRKSFRVKIEAEKTCIDSCTREKIGYSKFKNPEFNPCEVNQNGQPTDSEFLWMKNSGLKFVDL